MRSRGRPARVTLIRARRRWGRWHLTLRVERSDGTTGVLRARVRPHEVGSTAPGGHGDAVLDPRNRRRVHLLAPLIGPVELPPGPESEARGVAGDPTAAAPETAAPPPLGPDIPVAELIGLAQIAPEAVAAEIGRRVRAGEATPQGLLAECQRAGPAGIAAARVTVDALHRDGALGSAQLRILHALLGGAPPPPPT